MYTCCLDVEETVGSLRGRSGQAPAGCEGIASVSRCAWSTPAASPHLGLGRSPLQGARDVLGFMAFIFIPSW